MFLRSLVLVFLFSFSVSSHSKEINFEKDVAMDYVKDINASITILEPLFNRCSFTQTSGYYNNKNCSEFQNLLIVIRSQISYKLLYLENYVDKVESKRKIGETSLLSLIKKNTSGEVEENLFSFKKSFKKYNLLVDRVSLYSQ